MYFGYGISACQGRRIAWMTRFLDAVVYIGASLGSVSMMFAEFEAETEEIACQMRNE
jgi:hypothetical protein